MQREDTKYSAKYKGWNVRVPWNVQGCSNYGGKSCAKRKRKKRKTKEDNTKCRITRERRRKDQREFKLPKQTTVKRGAKSWRNWGRINFKAMKNGWPWPLNEVCDPLANTIAELSFRNVQLFLFTIPRLSFDWNLMGLEKERNRR